MREITGSVVLRQRGLTLVELMIAMLLGLMLLGGVVSVYISGKQSSQARDGLSTLQENGRTAIRQLEHGIQAAGYPFSDDIDPFIFDKKQLPATSTIPVTRDGNTAAGDLGDIVTIAFRPRIETVGDHLKTDCLGGAATENDLIINSYFVSYNATFRKNVLNCRGSGNAAAQPIAEGIDAMQVHYGVDDDESGQADRFLSATEVNAEGESVWAKVVSVQIALLVNSGYPIKDISARPDSDDYKLLGVSPDFDTIVPDSELAEKGRWSWRTFSATIPLRNRSQLCDGC